MQRLSLTAAITALLLSGLLLAPCLRAENPVRFRNIPLGEPVKTTKAKLENLGFKTIKTDTKEKSAYGDPQTFMLGELDGYPIVLSYAFNAETRKVYEMTLIWRECIDEDEALEVGDGLWRQETSKTPYFVVDSGNTNTGILEMPDSKGHLTRYIAIPIASSIARFYSDGTSSKESYLGCTTASVYRLTLHHEYVVELRYYDINAQK